MLEKALEQLELRGAIVNDSTKMNLFLDVSCIENWEKYQTNLENLYESKGELFQKALDIPFSQVADTSQGKENGIISRTSAIPQSTRNVFFGTLLIARARMTVTAKIITAPVKLIWSRFIITTSFQIANNLFQLLDLFLR